MDLLVVAPAVAWGAFIAYVTDLVTKKPDREWETFARYTPIRWMVSPNGRQFAFWIGAFLLLCAVASAWQRPVEAFVGFTLYAVTFGQTRWPWRKIPADDPFARSAFTLGLRVAADTFEALERRPGDRAKAANVTGIRFQSGILTVYVREADPALESFIKDYVCDHRPDLPAYVVVDGPKEPDPNVM